MVEVFLLCGHHNHIAEMALKACHVDCGIRPNLPQSVPDFAATQMVKCHDAKQNQAHLAIGAYGHDLYK